MTAVVITGASSGIGEACALHLDRRGFRVFAGVRRPEDAERLQAQASSRLTPVQIDVTDPDALNSAVALIREAVGRGGLAGLVNNAGVSMPGPVELLPLEELRRQLEVNVVGPVAVTQAFLPLIRAGRGRIVNVGSISGRATLPFLGTYAASKHALEALTDALRMELHPWGIHVSIVEPGRVATPFIERTRDRGRALLRETSPEGLALYGRTIGALEALEVGRPAMPVEPVVAAISHALTASRPKTRYLVGSDARLRLLLQWLPDRMRDRIILGQIQRAAPPEDGV